jgi:two-component system invasion response regulator UvrY
MAQIINVAVADDHILLRNALTVLINNTGKCKVVFEANNGIELIEKIKKENMPDVIILDLYMPEMDGYDTAVHLQSKYPDIKILMLTMFDNEGTLIRLLKAGVKGFMKKDIHPNELLHAIQSVHEHGFYYSAQTSSKLAGLFRATENGPSLEKIMMTDLEIEFMKLVCTELTYKEIAVKLKMNPRAIDGMRDNLFTKLDVKSRVGLAMHAIRQGIVGI